jgi:putative tricarboxylic transport membrane protein
MPSGILFPLIIVISAIGAFALNSSATDLYLILVFGVLGYLFEKADIPVAPLVLSLVLGGMMEQSFRQAMTVSGGNPAIFLQSTVARVLLALALMALLVPFMARLLRRSRAASPLN